MRARLLSEAGVRPTDRPRLFRPGSVAEQMGGSATPASHRLLGQLGREDSLVADHAQGISTSADSRLAVEKDMQDPTPDTGLHDRTKIGKVVRRFFLAPSVDSV